MKATSSMAVGRRQVALQSHAKGTPRPGTMTHEERRRLIDEFFARPVTFNIIEKKTHAGTLIERELPTAGRRRPSVYMGDESYGGPFTAVDLEDLIASMEG